MRREMIMKMIMRVMEEAAMRKMRRMMMIMK